MEDKLKQSKEAYESKKLTLEQLTQERDELYHQKEEISYRSKTYDEIIQDLQNQLNYEKERWSKLESEEKMNNDNYERKLDSLRNKLETTRSEYDQSTYSTRTSTTTNNNNISNPNKTDASSISELLF